MRDKIIDLVTNPANEAINHPIPILHGKIGRKGNTEQSGRWRWGWG
jgi:hypothetical protein